MKYIIIAVALLFSTAAYAQTFTAPPREALAMGLLLDYESAVYTEVLQPDVVREGCGDWDGCIARLPDGTCVVKVSVTLPGLMRKIVWEHLIARCAGWVP